MPYVKLDPQFRVTLSYAEMKLVSFALQGRTMRGEDLAAAKELARKLVKRQSEELKHYSTILEAASNQLDSEKTEQMVSDAALAEEAVPIDELEQFASRWRK